MNGNNVYLKVNSELSEDLYGLDNEKSQGKYLINGISANNVSKSLVGVVQREQEEYLALIFITKSGEVYFYSGYLMNMENRTAEKLNINYKVADVQQGYYEYNDEEFNTKSFISDLIITSQNGENYSFEDTVRSRGF